jgi:hypothetical protein
MAPLLFHGDPFAVLGFFAAAFFGTALLIALLIWAICGPKTPWIIPLVFLVVGLSVCSIETFTDNTYGMSLLFSSPWTLIAIFVLTGPTPFFADYLPFLFVALNAAIIYLIARYRSRRKLQTPA